LQLLHTIVDPGKVISLHCCPYLDTAEFLWHLNPWHRMFLELMT